MKRWMALFTAGTLGVNAAVYSPRVLSPHVADTHSMKLLPNSTVGAIWRVMQGFSRYTSI
jgi:hypothetical protein